MNAMNYDAMTLGNHEFNFGSEIFNGILKQATFPLLGPTSPMTARTAWRPSDPVEGRPAVRREDGRAEGIKVAILGITQPPRPELRAAEQHPRPDLHQPDHHGRRSCAAR